MNNTFKFYYKNDFLFNIVSILFVILFFLLSLLTFRLCDSNLIRFVIILFILLFLAMWMYFVKKKLEITVGEMEFSKKEFSYTSCGKTYYIDYKEVEYINKCFYKEDLVLFESESYYYEIKIKDAGYFIFRYIDNSLDDVMLELSKRCNIKIKE